MPRHCISCEGNDIRLSIVLQSLKLNMCRPSLSRSHVINVEIGFSSLFVVEYKVFELSMVEGSSVLCFVERCTGVSRAVTLGKCSVANSWIWWWRYNKRRGSKVRSLSLKDLQ